MSQTERSSHLSLEKENFPDSWEEAAVAPEQNEDVLDPIVFPEFGSIEEFTSEAIPQPEVIGEDSGNGN